MLFGLCNASATFQRLMNLILAGVQYSRHASGPIAADPGSVSGGTFQCMQFLPFFNPFLIPVLSRSYLTSKTPDKLSAVKAWVSSHLLSMIFIAGRAIIPMVTCLGHMTNASYLKLVILAFTHKLLTFSIILCYRTSWQLFSIVAMLLSSQVLLFGWHGHGLWLRGVAYHDISFGTASV